jgi:hypothetical protein
MEDYMYKRVFFVILTLLFVGNCFSQEISQERMVRYNTFAGNINNFLQFYFNMWVVNEREYERARNATARNTFVQNMSARANNAKDSATLFFERKLEHDLPSARTEFINDIKRMIERLNTIETGSLNGWTGVLN